MIRQLRDLAAGWTGDLSFGGRLLRKHPGVTAVAVLTLALGIGSTATTFSVVNAILIRPLPFPDPDRLVAVWRVDRATPENWFTPPAGQFVDWKRESRSFESVGAGRNRSFTLTSFDDPDTPLAREVSAGYFETLGAKPQLGRLFRPEEDRPGGPKVLLLNDELWHRRFGGDPNVLGKTTELDGVPFEIVGVMPPGFDNPAFGTPVPPQVWLPMALPESGLNRSAIGYLIVAKLRPGVTVRQAQQDLDAIASELARIHPDTDTEIAPLVTPLKEGLVRNVRSSLLVLFGAVALVLLVACGNVANLLLTQAVGRRREIAVRRAFGATAMHLVRQLAIESLVLTSLGGIGGLILTAWATGSIGSLLPDTVFAPQFHITIDSNVVLFTLGLTLATGLVFGVIPAVRALRSNLEVHLWATAGRSSGGPKGIQTRRTLVVAEIAMSLVLLIGAGLLLRSFFNLQRHDPGFDSGNLLTFRVSTRGPFYAMDGQRAEFFKRVLEGIEKVPGVVSAGSVDGLPFFPFNESPIAADSLPPAEPGREPRALIRRVLPGYLETFKTPLVRGRDINHFDTAESAPVALISQTLARQLWSDRDPIGDSLKILSGDGGMVSRQIVGIVADVRGREIPLTPDPMVYVPLVQAAIPQSMGFIVRTRSNPMGALEGVQRAVHRVDRGMPVYVVRTMDEVIRGLDWRTHLITWLLSVFAVIAVCLAATGIYAVFSYMVSQRVREIAIRMALGAERRGVLALILRGGLFLTSLGVALGVLVSLGLTGLLKNHLFGVNGADPGTYIGLSLFLLGVALFATLFPAWQATRVNPVVALKAD